jgi:geranylgeranyl diphosphate synthase type II
VENDLYGFIEKHREVLENGLNDSLPVSRYASAASLNEALRYAVFPGGKRLRPMLTLAGASVVGARVADALPAACAMEFLHTSSLILDDLPGMDDATLRRGRAALHLVYGEGIAMLAALALLNQSYALLADRRAVSEIARCIGADGMIGGQAADITRHAEMAGLNALSTRSLKTAALMRMTMTAGAIMCGASEEDVTALGLFGEHLGTAYQIYDDLLDELGDMDEAGKSLRQDSRHLRPSFAGELGLGEAQAFAAGLIEQAKFAASERFGGRRGARLLTSAADFILAYMESLRERIEMVA